MAALFSVWGSTFFAGFLTSLTPCVYPMIPLSLGYLGSRSSGLKKSTVISFVTGQTLTFAAMGLAAVSLGEVFGFLSENSYVQVLTGLFFILMAYFSYRSELPSWIQKPLQFLNRKFSKNTIGVKEKKTNLLEALVAGAVSTLIASPCATPVLGGVLVIVSQSNSQLKGAALMAVYGLGLSMLFLVLGLGLVKGGKLPKSGIWMTKIHHLSLILLFASGIYFVGRGISLWTL